MFTINENDTRSIGEGRARRMTFGRDLNADERRHLDEDATYDL